MKSTIHEHKKQIKMNVSKKAITLLTICLFMFAGTQTANAQTKEETVKYISDLYSQVHLEINPNGVKYEVESVTLDGKVLVIKNPNATIPVHRYYLMEYGTLEVVEGKSGANGYIYGKYYVSDGKKNLVCCIALENDAQRLKNALEHLIKLLKAEPETDPFAN